MGKALFGSGPANPMWKGGETTDPRGYVLVRVGKGHPLADCRGYAYRHRLEAEKAGKPVVGLVVHHADDRPGSDAPGNLEPMTRAEHAKRHRYADRTGRKVLRDPGQANEQALCACGCGGTFDRFDREGRARKYISGHNLRRGQSNG